MKHFNANESDEWCRVEVSLPTPPWQLWWQLRLLGSELRVSTFCFILGSRSFWSHILFFIFSSFSLHLLFLKRVLYSISQSYLQRRVGMHFSVHWSDIHQTLCMQNTHGWWVRGGISMWVTKILTDLQPFRTFIGLRETPGVLWAAVVSSRVEIGQIQFDGKEVVKEKWEGGSLCVNWMPYEKE